MINHLISHFEDKGKEHGNKNEEAIEEITEEQYIQMEKNLLFFLDEYFKNFSFSWNIKKVYLNMKWSSRKNMLKMLDIKFMRMSKKEMMDAVLDALDMQLKVDDYCAKLMGRK
jgi:hypothetical protein